MEVQPISKRIVKQEMKMRSVFEKAKALEKEDSIQSLEQLNTDMTGVQSLAQGLNNLPGLN